MKSVSTVAIAICLFAQTFSNASAKEDRIFYVKIDAATELQGQIIDNDSLKVTTAFGDVNIPMDKVEAVKIGVDKDNTAVIAFTNGDLVTGKIDMDELHLKTSWGKAHINVTSIDSISASQFGNFYADPSGGWRYSRGNAPKNQFNGAGLPGSTRGSGTR